MKRIFEDSGLEKGCPFSNTNHITFLVLHLTLTFSGASGSAQEMHLRVCFLSRQDKTFSSLMDMLLKSLPLLLPQKDHLVLAANIATLGLMMARLLASSAGEKGSHWQSCTLLSVGRDQVWVVGLEKASSRETGPVSVFSRDRTKNLEE